MHSHSHCMDKERGFNRKKSTHCELTCVLGLGSLVGCQDNLWKEKVGGGGGMERRGERERLRYIYMYH